MIRGTGYLNSVALHDDGRITLTRAMPREGIFLHIEFTTAEIEALKQVLASRDA